MNKTEILKSLKTKTRMMADLIVELEESLLFEAAEVVIDQIEKRINTGTRDLFVVYHKAQGKVVYHGNLRECTKYCTRHSLPYYLRTFKKKKQC